jgi:protein-S-isoprenylcysteine O-methyltransferase Ste14
MARETSGSLTNLGLANENRSHRIATPRMATAVEKVSAAPNPVLLISRIAAAVLGGYAFVWGFTTLTIAVALSMDTPYDEAQTLAYLLVFLGAFLWTFAVRSVLRAWLVLAGGGALMTAIAWSMTR